MQQIVKQTNATTRRKVRKPHVVVGQKSPALNGMGYIFWTLCPVGEAFIENEAKWDKNLLEIGPGFGSAMIAALEQGVGGYTALELSKEHIDVIMDRVRGHFKNKLEQVIEKLTLLQGAAPKDLPDVHEHYDAILVDKCIHYFSPSEMQAFVTWVTRALKKGGRLYVTAVSAYSIVYRKVLPLYLERKARGEFLPGRFEGLMDYFEEAALKNYPEFHLPEEVTLFSTDDLRELFTTDNLTVEQTFSISIPTAERTSWALVDESESNIVGAIVVKQ